MAVTTLAEINSKLRQPSVYAKATYTPPAAVTNYTKFGSDWYTTGSPPASVATTIGVNGEAVTPALASVGSRITRYNPGAGNNAYIAKLTSKRLTGGSNTPLGAIVIVDRLWQNSGLSVTSTTAQAITPATLPARDRLESTNGDGVLIGIEWSATSGAGTPTITLTYTDSAGTPNITTSMVISSTASAGTIEVFPLADGDNGVRAPTSFIQSATRTSGTMHLVMFRVLAIVPIVIDTGSAINDAIQLAMPKVYDNSVLQVLTLGNGASAGSVGLQYLETQG